MKLRNKRTGEIIEVDNIYTFAEGKHKKYNSLKDFNEEWEDYEEPEEYWYLSGGGDIIYAEDANTVFDKEHKFIGNYFSSIEEAEKAVGKLKAWKRLKDKGFKLWSFKKSGYGIDLDYYTITVLSPRDKEALDLLFGGEE